MDVDAFNPDLLEALGYTDADNLDGDLMLMIMRHRRANTGETPADTLFWYGFIPEVIRG